MTRPKAVLDTDPRTEADHLGFLRFETPDGKVDIIMVTDGPSFDKYPDREPFKRCPVWHIDIIGDVLQLEAPEGIMLGRNPNGTMPRVVVNPSIHVVDKDGKERYHTSTHVEFDLVADLPA